jgi:hypothetical protein
MQLLRLPVKARREEVILIMLALEPPLLIRSFSYFVNTGYAMGIKCHA